MNERSEEAHGERLKDFIGGTLLKAFHSMFILILTLHPEGKWELLEDFYVGD